MEPPSGGHPRRLRGLADPLPRCSAGPVGQGQGHLSGGRRSPEDPSQSTASRKARVSAWRGASISCCGRPLLEDPALVEERHPVGDLAGEAHLVGDHHHRHVQVGGERLHDREHLAGELRVERRGRLVEEHHVGLHRERAGDGDALLLTAREPDGVLPRLVGQADPVEEVLGPLGDLGGARPGATGRAEDVVEHRHVGEQVELLEDHADVQPELADLLALAPGAVPALEPDAGHLDRSRRWGPR